MENVLKTTRLSRATAELKNDLERARMATIVPERRLKAKIVRWIHANGRTGATGPNAQPRARAECNHESASATTTTVVLAIQPNHKLATRIAVLVRKTASLTSHWCLN